MSGPAIRDALVLSKYITPLFYKTTYKSLYPLIKESTKIPSFLGENSLSVLTDAISKCLSRLAVLPKKRSLQP